MTEALFDLVQAWRKCRVDKLPFIFPEDEVLCSPKLRDKVSAHRSFNHFMKHATARDYFGYKAELDKLHLGLIPIPYMGNLRRASIFILMLNPGFRPQNYFAEADPNFKKALIKNLYQRNQNKDFPFVTLDPRLAWQSDYWPRKFERILKELIEKKKITYREALRVIANKVACLQYAPYHSKSGLPRALPTLASTSKILEHVHEVILPKVETGNALVIVMRKSRAWGLPRHRNIIKYKGLKLALDI
ncbi:hypothetical protein MYX84_00875 [Acidobacteria bacterium AH-259-O06]|nr:hypothetical protein [Acidobacteria bacterium AH-259-O06]